MQILRSVISHQVSFVVKSWFADILSLLPSQVREKLLMRQRLVITSIENGLCLHIARGDNQHDPEAVWSQDLQGWIDQGAVDKLLALSRDHFIDLDIPKSHILTQTIVLPRLAGENLDEAVAFGLSTWTPFAADEVYFAAYPISVDKDQITVSIRYALQLQIQPLIEQASRTSLPPDRLVFDGNERWNVLLNIKKNQRIRWQRRLDIALSAAACVLALVLVLAAGWRQEDKLTAYQNVLRREVGLLAKQNDTRKALEAAVTRQTIVARNRAEHYSMSEILSVLGRHLPPGVSVLDIEIAANKGRIEITNADSATLRESLLSVNMMTEVEIDDSVPGHPVTVIFTLPKIKP